MIFFISLEGFQSTGGRYPSTCLIMYLEKGRVLSQLNVHEEFYVPAWWVYYTPPSWLSLHRKLGDSRNTSTLITNALCITNTNSNMKTFNLPDSDIPSVQSIAALVIDRWWWRRPWWSEVLALIDSSTPSARPNIWIYIFQFMCLWAKQQMWQKKT